MEYTFSRRMSTIKASAIREILKATADPNMISFAGGNPAAQAFPVEALSKISAEILKNEPISVLQYGITEGYPKLIEQATKFFNTHETAVTDNDKVIITSGSQQIMDFAGKCLCNEGDIVVSENPSFLGALNAFKSNAAIVKGVGYKDGQLDIEELEVLLSADKKPRFIYLIPNFQNPTGITMSLETRKKVLELAKKYQVLILEDNPYGDLRFEGERIPSIKSLDKDGLVIYAASLSKIIAPGMRVACCIAPAQIIEKFVVAKQAGDVHSNMWAQRVMAEFLEKYDMEKHLEALQDIYRHKCTLMLDEMKKNFHPSLKYTIPTGGMFIWVTLPDNLDMKEFVQEALKQNVAVVPGNAFLVDDSQPCQCFRMNFSTPRDEQIVEGVSILGKLSYSMQ